MTEPKKERSMKVYEKTVERRYIKDQWAHRGYRIIPQIILQGVWLEQLGFEPGEEIKVECEEGHLVIRKSD